MHEKTFFTSGTNVFATVLSLKISKICFLIKLFFLTKEPSAVRCGAEHKHVGSILGVAAVFEKREHPCVEISAHAEDTQVV